AADRKSEASASTTLAAAILNVFALGHIIKAHRSLLVPPCQFDARRGSSPSGDRRRRSPNARNETKVCPQHYGYSKANAIVPIFSELKSVFTLGSHDQRVGCQVFASPTAYPSDVLSCVCRVAGRPRGRPA